MLMEVYPKVQVMHHQAFHEQTKSVVTGTFNDFLYKSRSPGVFCLWDDGYGISFVSDTFFTLIK